MVGWAILALVNGEWRTEEGWLLPGESVTAAECTAAVKAFSLCMQGGRIVTDCKAVRVAQEGLGPGGGGRHSQAELLGEARSSRAAQT